MKRRWKIFLWVGLFIAGFLITVLVAWSLWNWLVPPLFNGPVLTFFQTIGLVVLCRLLFKGLFSWPHHCGNGRWGGVWKSHWQAKWEGMSNEDKEKFRERIREKCGWPFPSQEKAE